MTTQPPVPPTAASTATDDRGRIVRVVVTPVAFHAAPRYIGAGIHEPFALRSVVEVVTASGPTGLGESDGDEEHLRRLERVAGALVGLDVRDPDAVRAAVVRTADDRPVLAPFEVACLDAEARLAGVPVHALLGGQVRDRVPWSTPLFYTRAGHPGAPDDEVEALDPPGLVRQADRLARRSGLGAITLHGGVLPPATEVAAMRTLRHQFPGVALGLVAHGAWTVETSRWVAHELAGVVDQLDDPTPGVEGLGAVAQEAATLDPPLGVSASVRTPDELASALAVDALREVRVDPHAWGGLRAVQDVAARCADAGRTLSLEAPDHLGVSFAALTHLAAATPLLARGCDTPWSWRSPDEDVVRPGAPGLVDGAAGVPTAPGLGVELDRAALARLHRQYRDCGLRTRDDAGYLRRLRPDADERVPRW
ncbi:enolase C-terminal domain-like protein [Nocardioides sp. C4-1]|uniref:enolase C-terminal domain-like protein n=1 Tax=Nocardioides sp. C4-1 TaxID=3151851 RepID=UPI003264DC84